MGKEIKGDSAAEPELALCGSNKSRGWTRRDRAESIGTRVVDRWYKIHVSTYQVRSLAFNLCEVANTICASVCAHIAEAKVYVGHRGNKGSKQNGRQIGVGRVAQI